MEEEKNEGEGEKLDYFGPEAIMIFVVAGMSDFASIFFILILPWIMMAILRLFATILLFPKLKHFLPKAVLLMIAILGFFIPLPLFTVGIIICIILQNRIVEFIVTQAVAIAAAIATGGAGGVAVEAAAAGGAAAGEAAVVGVEAIAEAGAVGAEAATEAAAVGAEAGAAGAGTATEAAATEGVEEAEGSFARRAGRKITEKGKEKLKEKIEEGLEGQGGPEEGGTPEEKEEKEEALEEEWEKMAGIEEPIEELMEKELFPQVPKIQKNPGQVVPSRKKEDTPPNKNDIIIDRNKNEVDLSKNQKGAA